MNEQTGHVEAGGESEPEGRYWLGMDAFTIAGVDGEYLPLQQTGESEFTLPSNVVITFHKETGLEKFVARGDLSWEDHHKALSVTASDVPTFDLASVPGPMRWFSRAYGVHTPAALFHDRLIVDDPRDRLLSEVHADRYFRYMLAAVGVPRLKRYVMWTATAMRTRWVGGGTQKRLLLLLWVLLATAGIATFVMSTLDLIFGTGMAIGKSAILLPVSLVVPLVASGLWGKQFGAGIVAAVAAVWILAPALLALVGYVTYLGLERIAAALFGQQEALDGDEAMKRAKASADDGRVARGDDDPASPQTTNPAR